MRRKRTGGRIHHSQCFNKLLEDRKQMKKIYALGQYFSIRSEFLSPGDIWHIFVQFWLSQLGIGGACATGSSANAEKCE